MSYAKFISYWVEASLALMEKSGCGLEKQCVMFDMDGWNLFKHGGPWGMSLTNTLTSTVQDQYPERLWKSIMFKSPKVFTIAWRIIKPWLDVKTLEKVMFTDDPNDLLTIIDADQLHIRHGGTRTEEYPILGVDGLI